MRGFDWSRAISLPVLLLLLGGTSCSQLIIQTDFDPDADFTRYTTYRWYQPPRPERRAVDSAVLFDISIRRAVDEELQSRGFRKAEGGKPDFGVAYRIGIQQKVDVMTTEYRTWRGRVVDQRVDAYPYKEGTVVLDLIDADTKQLAWRGWATGIVDSPERVQERIGSIVHQILERFPPSDEKPGRSF